MARDDAPLTIDGAAAGGAPVPVAAPTHLRVLSGRQAGATHRLPHERAITIGHSFEHDVVLRSGATQGLSTELHIGADRTLLRVRDGAVTLLGREVGAGEAVLVPNFIPVAFGDIAFAVGHDSAARWEEAEALVARLGDPVAIVDDQPRAELGERLSTRLDPTRARVAPLIPRAGWVAVVVLALVAVLIAVPLASRWLSVDPGDPAAVQRALAQQGFATLKVAPDPATGAVQISGVVAADADVVRLNHFVAENLPGALVEVDSAAGIAATAVDILRAQGIDATARVVRNQVLVVEGPFLPADREREVADLLRADLPAVRSIEFRRAAGAGSADLQYFFNDGKSGPASFVDDGMGGGHISTADGSRWFKGSVLPTGHRIVSITGGTITLERNGETEQLEFAPAPPPSTPVSGAPTAPAASQDTTITNPANPVS